jgi:hypothetical protein
MLQDLCIVKLTWLGEMIQAVKEACLLEDKDWTDQESPQITIDSISHLKVAPNCKKISNIKFWQNRINMHKTSNQSMEMSKINREKRVWTKKE